MELSWEVVAVGAFTGLAYAVLGAGLVLIYRASGVINFAHGEIGAFGGAVMAKLVIDAHFNFYIGFVVAGVVGAAMAMLWELTVVRRLFHAPRLILLVATIGISQVMFAMQLLIPEPTRAGRFPTATNRILEIGSVTLRGENFLMIAFVPAVMVALALFLNRTPYGMAVRASADEPDVATLAGISVKRVSTMTWGIAGFLAATTFVAIAPVRGVLVGSSALATNSLGPGLLVRALAAALVGRLISFPLTIVGGLVLGIVEALLFVNVGDPGDVSFVLFIFVFAMVLWRGREAVQDRGTGGFSLVQKLSPVPAHLLKVAWVRRLPMYTTGGLVGLGLLLPFIFTRPSRQFMFSEMLLMAIVGLSVVVLTGWAGQLSLGQFGFVGIGAIVTASLNARGMPFAVAVAYATLAGGLAALLIGLPALRIRGLFLAVTTLAFALAIPDYVLTRGFFITDSKLLIRVPRAKLGPLDFTSQRSYYFLCLLVTIIVFAMVAGVRGSGVGRRIIAVRDNEASAAAFTVSPTAAKLTAFGLSGAIAALAGGMLAGLYVLFGTQKFLVETSLQVVSMAIIGGLGSIFGALLGALYIVGLPALLGSSAQVRTLTSGTGLLLLLLFLPGGLTQVVYRLRDLLVARAEPQAAALVADGVDADGVGPGAEPAEAVAPTPVVTVTAEAGGDGTDLPSFDPSVPLVAARNVTVRFGGLVALDDVTIAAYAGETLGLIGSNGAGKSTLMNVISGFITADAGTIELTGHDVTDLPPYRRAGVGVARLFQDARLFNSLTVRESVTVALEARERSELFPALLALPPARRAERAKRREADELITFLGLGRYADSFISVLSTGTRRITELACVLALEPRVLLLDEPTAGIAQRETEAFGPLIDRIKQELDATLVLIEHDMPLVMALSDRMYCMSAGRVIAEGLPDRMRNDPAVIAAYLGTDERAIVRSDVPASVVTPAGDERPSASGSTAVLDRTLASLTKRDLMERARERGLKGLSRLSKEELVVLLEDSDG